MKIRPLTVDDESVLWEMLYLAIYVPDGEPMPPLDIVYESGLRCYVEGWPRPHDVGFMALDDGQPVGAAWLRLFSPTSHGYGFVDAQIPELTIALKPAYRGQGVGTILLRKLFAAASHPTLSLSVSPTNPAKRLYERLGFMIVGEYGGSLVMCKQLHRS